MEQTHLLKSPHANTLIWAILYFLVGMTYLTGILIDWDDWSVLRASSFMSRHPNDPILTQLNHHLEEKANDLGVIKYNRYKIRLSVGNNYVIQNWLVGVMEQLPSYSVYQTVFLANAILHLVAVTILFLILGWLYGAEANVLRVFIILAMLPLPFEPRQHFWFAFVPRGVTLVLFFAAMLLWLNLGDPGIPRIKRYGTATLLTIACFLSHQSMAVLLLLPTLLVWLLHRIFKLDPLRLAGTTGLAGFMLLFNAGIIAAAIIKSTLLLYYGADEVRYFENIPALIWWILATNLLIYAWLNMRLKSSGEESLLTQNGDVFARYLVPFSIVALGFNVFQPDEKLFWARLFVPTEASLRFFSIVHLLWWLLFGIFLVQKFKPQRIIGLRVGLVVALVVVCAGTVIRLNSKLTPEKVERMFRTENSALRMDTVLARPGEKVYSNEVLYFQALANELKARHSTENYRPEFGFPVEGRAEPNQGQGHP